MQITYQETITKTIEINYDEITPSTSTVIGKFYYEILSANGYEHGVLEDALYSKEKVRIEAALDAFKDAMKLAKTLAAMVQPAQPQYQKITMIKAAREYANRAGIMDPDGKSGLSLLQAKRLVEHVIDANENGFNPRSFL